MNLKTRLSRLEYGNNGTHIFNTARLISGLCKLGKIERNEDEILNQARLYCESGYIGLAGLKRKLEERLAPDGGIKKLISVRLDTAGSFYALFCPILRVILNVFCAVKIKEDDMTTFICFRVWLRAGGNLGNT